VSEGGDGVVDRCKRGETEERNEERRLRESESSERERR